MTTALPALPGVRLEDLPLEAALMTRTDRKYVLTEGEAADALADLPAGTRVLEVAGRRELGYRSTYFDTAGLDAFAATATGRRRSWKVRTRTYVDTGECWLEVKTRGPHGRTVKERTPHPASTPEELGEDGARFVADRLREARAERVTGLAAVRHLRPVLRSTYSRVALVVGDGTSRASIDRDLAWHAPDGVTRRPRDLVILETKSPGAPSALDRRLWTLGHRPRRVSKFGTGLVLLDPALNHHRWNRLLGAGSPLTG